MDRDTIKCFFCGGKANVEETDGLKIVSCPACGRKTELDTYQGLLDVWMGDIRNKDGEI